MISLTWSHSIIRQIMHGSRMNPGLGFVAYLAAWCQLDFYWRGVD